MLRQSKNVVNIEGILSEIDLKYSSYEANGQTVECIKGEIIVRVEQSLAPDTPPKVLYIPVVMFAKKMTKNNTLNPSYTSIERVMNEYVSIAACGDINKADCVRITSGYLVENVYMSLENKLISYPRVSTSFVSRIKREEMTQGAFFNAELFIHSMSEEVDNNNTPTGNTVIKGIIVQYGGKVDAIEFKVINPKVVAAINRYWSAEKTVAVMGKLDFSTEVVMRTIECDIGESYSKPYTTSVSNLIITGGSSTPLAGDQAYSITEINAGLTERMNRIEQRKRKEGQTRRAPAVPANAPSAAPIDLGF